ncbi:MAG: hypothetical protein NC123_18895 [Butyrivibrio sp.]|nr:hypothetical protein [Acetatifactor muris]MCM1561580.1 hypothetical protein [Butyrivibrio sp.]
MLTNKEKTMNAKIKKKMQEKGIIPPDKPRLNRKRYIEEAMREWNGRDKDCCLWSYYLCDAISIMMGHIESNLRASKEAVGAAKCLKLAVRLKEFSDKLKAEGRKQYTVGEQLEFIQDILDA